MGTMEKLSEKIYAVVRAIPPGRVSTYGRVAAMAGIPLFLLPPTLQKLVQYYI